MCPPTASSSSTDVHDGISEIVAEAKRLRSMAHAGPIGKRHSSFELYDLLALCMALADRCRMDRGNGIALRDLVRGAAPKNVKGRWVERASDEYLLVCRYVFPNGSRSAERSNASRYAHALREAAKQQIRPDNLVEVLKTNGGINALYLRRPLDASTVATKTLHLSSTITVTKGQAFSLTLRRNADNTFEVLNHLKPVEADGGNP